MGRRTPRRRAETHQRGWQSRATIRLATFRVLLLLGIVMAVLWGLPGQPDVPAVLAQTTTDIPNAIDDIEVVTSDSKSKEPCRSGWEQLDGESKDLNAGVGGKYIYLCFHRSSAVTDPDPTWITEVDIVSTGNRPSSSPCKAGWVWVQKDLNEGAEGDFVWVCFKRGGEYPIVRMKTISGGDFDTVENLRCSWDNDDDWDRDGTDLNSGLHDGTKFFNVHRKHIYLCTKNAAQYGGWTFDCGNEGESPCGWLSRFYWENGLGGAKCDRGLSVTAGKCYNDSGNGSGRMRHTTEIGSFRGTWLWWALDQQRRLARFEPISNVMHLAAHNAFNSWNDGYGTKEIDDQTNQHFSISDMLDAGIRVVDLDVHKGLKSQTGYLPSLCHGDDDNVGCAFTDRKWQSAVKEIANWLVANPDEYVVIVVEDYNGPLDSSDSGNLDRISRMFNDPIDVFLAMDSRIGVFTLEDHRANGGFPSHDWLVRNNKRAIIMTQEGYFGGPYAFKKGGDGDPLATNFKAGVGIGDFGGYPDCVWGGKGTPRPFGAHDGLFGEVYGDSLVGGTHNLSRSEFASVARCDVSIVGSDDILRTGLTELNNGQTPPSGSRADALLGAAWAWKPGDRGNLGDCAAWTTSGFTSVPCDATNGTVNSSEVTRQVACLPRDFNWDQRITALQAANPWKITTNKSRWSGGQQACDQAFPGQNTIFSAPVNGLQHQLMLEQVQALTSSGAVISSLWINYRRFAVDGWGLGNEMVGPRIIFRFKTDNPNFGSPNPQPRPGPPRPWDPPLQSQTIPYMPGTWINRDIKVTVQCVSPAGTRSLDLTQVQHHDIDIRTGQPTRDSGYISDGVNQSVTATCEDNRGRKAKSTMDGINIERTAPTLQIVGVKQGDTLNELNLPTIDCNATDSQSGIWVKPILTITNRQANGPKYGEGVGQFTATCDKTVDQAENVTNPVTVNFTVAPEKVPPVLDIAEAQYTPPLNAAGWGKGDVVVSVPCVDPGTTADPPSGPLEPTLTATVTGEGSNLVAAVQANLCKDKAGNVAVQAATLPAIKIDRTAPTTVARTSVQPDARGVYTAPLTVTLTASDALSGLKAIVYSASGAQTIPETSVSTTSVEIPIGKAGETTINYRARDAADNDEQQKTLTVRLFPSQCEPRPQAIVNVTPDGTGRLKVTVSSGTRGNTTTNPLRAVRFQLGTNALVDVEGQTGRSGAFTVDLPAHPQSLTFYVRRATPGQAVQLPLAVVDDCGDWSTFVGGGPTAF